MSRFEQIVELVEAMGFRWKPSELLTFDFGETPESSSLTPSGLWVIIPGRVKPYWVSTYGTWSLERLAGELRSERESAAAEVPYDYPY